MTRDWDKEEVSLIWIFRTKPTLANILEKVTFAGVFTGQFPGSLVESFRIAVGVNVDLEFLLHFFEIHLEKLRRVINIGKKIVVVVFLFFADIAFFFLGDDTRLRRSCGVGARGGGGGGGREESDLRSGWGERKRRTKGFEGEVSE